MIAELLAKAAVLTPRRGTPVSSQKCFSLVMNVRCYKNLGKKNMMACLLNAGTGEYAGCLLRSNTSIYGKESYSSSRLTVHDVTQIFVRFETPTVCPLPQVEVRTHTNVTHSATPYNHTYDMQPPLLNTFCLVSTCVSASLGSTSSKPNSNWVYGLRVISTMLEKTLVLS